MVLNYGQLKQEVSVFSPTYEKSDIKTFTPYDLGMINSLVIRDQAQAVYFLRGTLGGTMVNHSPGEPIPTKDLNDSVDQIEPKWRPYSDGVRVNASQLYGRRSPTSLNLEDPALQADIMALATSQLGVRLANTGKLNMMLPFVPSVVIDGETVINETGLVEEDWTTGSDSPYAGNWNTAATDILAQSIYKRDNFYGVGLPAGGMTMLIGSKQRTNMQRNDTIKRDKDLTAIEFRQVTERLAAESISVVICDDTYYIDDLISKDDIYTVTKIKRFLEQDYIILIPNAYFNQPRQGLIPGQEAVTPKSRTAPFIDFLRATPPDFQYHAQMLNSRIGIPQTQYLTGIFDGAYIYVGADLVRPDQEAVFKALAVTSFANFVSPAVKIHYVKVST